MKIETKLRKQIKKTQKNLDRAYKKYDYNEISVLSNVLNTQLESLNKIDLLEKRTGKDY